MGQTVSECLIDTLADMGVKQIFGIVGDALNSVTDALRRDGRIEWIGTRHEEVAAYAAGAQAQLTGQLGVCAGTVGPGAIHLLNGLYDAAKSHAPVLAITGQVPLAEVGSNYFQEVDIKTLFEDVSVYNETIVSQEQMPRILHLAIEEALSKRGVSVITIPGDIGPQKMKGSRNKKVFVQHPPSVPADDYLKQAADMINKAKTVTLLAGIGAHNAREQVLEFAEKIKAPIAYTLKGKETFEYDNPHAVGMTGLIGNHGAAHAIKKADLLFMVGTDFPYRQWLPQENVIQLDVQASHLGRRCPIDLGMVGDSKCSLEALLPLVNEKTDSGHRDKYVKEFHSWQDSQHKHASITDKTKAPIRPEAVAAAINEYAADDAIFTMDVGMSTVWAGRFLQMRKGQRMIGSYNLGSMASAMPQAIGAQALYPNRQVISFSGDGGFTMLLGDFITAVSYNLPVKIVVFNNHRLGMVKLEQEVAGIPETGTILKNPDFSKVAEAMGATGIRIEKPQDLFPGIKKAFETDGPVVVDVVTNPNEISMPPGFDIDQAWGFAIAKIGEELHSRNDD